MTDNDKELVKRLREAEELARAWEEAISGLEAYLKDREAMRDEVTPSLVLEVLRGFVRDVPKYAEQCLAARWHDYLRQQDRIEAQAAEIERLRAALHCISLGSQDSGTTKEQLGREARAALKDTQ